MGGNECKRKEIKYRQKTKKDDRIENDVKTVSVCPKTERLNSVI